MFNKLGAVCGILSAVLVPVGFAILTAGGMIMTDLSSTPHEIEEGLDSAPGTAVWVGGYIECAAFLFLILFAMWLRAHMREAGDASWLPDAASSAAVLLVGLGLLSFTCGGVFLWLGGTDVDPSAGVALMYVRMMAYAISHIVAAVFLGCVATSVLRTGLLARPLAWMAAVLVPAFLVAGAVPKTDFAQLPDFVMLLWVLAVSITLLRRRDITLRPHDGRTAEALLHSN
jgi:hypothetical protein